MATLYNSITCELEAGALAFICSLFSVGGYVTALTFLTLKFFLFSKDLCDNPPPHTPPPPLIPLWGVQENAFTAALLLCSVLRCPSLLSSPFKPGNTTPFLTSVQEPGTSCVVKRWWRPSSVEH